MKSSKGLNAGGHWGELPTREMHKQEVITPDIIENVWRQVLEDANSIDCDYMDQHTEYIQMPPENSHVTNTIHFHQQLRDMEDGINISAAPIEIDEPAKASNPFNFLPPYTDRSKILQNSSPVYNLKPESAHQLLKHSVYVLLAHIGYETASEIAIETLTNVGEHFLRRMALLLKEALEHENNGFPDAVERVLLETGIGSVVDLHYYYQDKIIRYEEIMKRKVDKMAEERRQLELNSLSIKTELEEAAGKLQFEDIDEFGNVCREVPTLQLLDPDMGFPPSLDAGFQMLHSLEQDELNSLEVEEEDVNVNDSPNVAQRTDNPSEKKK